MIFVLTEKIGEKIEQYPIFEKERTVITFGRSSLCEYVLLSDRPQELNRKISKMQATLEKKSGQWTLHSGCIAISARGDIEPKPPGSPLFLGSSELVENSIPMTIGLSVYLYRELEDYCILTATDEDGLEEIMNPSQDDLDATQGYDLMQEIQGNIETLRTEVKEIMNVVSGIQVSLQALFTSERSQNKRLDTHSKTIVKTLCALGLVATGTLGGYQLFDNSQRREIAYDLVKLVLSASTGLGGLALFKDTIDKKDNKS
jgi:hypothetical protein